MNKVMLIGNVGQDPTIKTIGENTLVAQLRIATTERGYTTSSGQQVPDRTEWHTIILWRKLADIVQKYVHKGDKLFIEGKIQSREFEKDNVKQRSFEIVADNLELLTPRQSQQQPQTAALQVQQPITASTPPPASFWGNEPPF